MPSYGASLLFLSLSPLGPLILFGFASLSFVLIYTRILPHATHHVLHMAARTHWHCLFPTPHCATLAFCAPAPGCLPAHRSLMDLFRCTRDTLRRDVFTARFYLFSYSLSLFGFCFSLLILHFTQHTSSRCAALSSSLYITRAYGRCTVAINVATHRFDLSISACHTHARHHLHASGTAARARISFSLSMFFCKRDLSFSSSSVSYISERFTHAPHSLLYPLLLSLHTLYTRLEPHSRVCCRTPARTLLSIS